MTNKVKVTLTIDKDIWVDFRAYALASGMSASQVLEFTMRTLLSTETKSLSQLVDDAFKEGLSIVTENKEKKKKKIK